MVVITAGHVEVTGLPVQREPGQVHGAAAQQARPDAVEDVTVREDSDVEVGGEDLVEPRHLLVPEEGVRHPDLARVSEGEVADLLWREISLKRSVWTVTHFPSPAGACPGTSVAGRSISASELWRSRIPTFRCRNY